MYPILRRQVSRLTLATLVLLAGPAATLLADAIEFTDGRSVEGKITARTDQSVTITMKVGTRDYPRDFPLDRVRAITVDGKREAIGAPSDATSTEPATGVPRTPEDVKAMIEKLGRSTPDWWGSVELKYPRGLDLNWSQPRRGVWNNQRYVGQYVWDVINPNPSKWREGVYLMHHLLRVNQDRTEVRDRVMVEIGRMYHDLLQDYARAAFWWQKAGVDKTEQASLHAVHLAECYAKLGCKEMAVGLLNDIPPHFAMIKAWADMGEIDRALRLADANSSGSYADIAYIYAGDACRVAGQHERALQYYEKLLALPANGNAWKRIQVNHQRARDNAEGIRLFELLDLGRVPDGTYLASSEGFKGDVYVEVSVKSRRIASVRVTQHHEKQFYSALTDVPRKIVAKQSVKGVDATSGATITSEAIINATAKALAGGMRRTTVRRTESNELHR
jgi:uncharacterized protein with FMN-binding domain